LLTSYIQALIARGEQQKHGGALRNKQQQQQQQQQPKPLEWHTNKNGYQTFFGNGKPNEDHQQKRRGEFA
jgi:hypothetical protein